eukprot:gene21311-25596_t
MLGPSLVEGGVAAEFHRRLLDALRFAAIEHALDELLVIVAERFMHIGAEQHVAGPRARQAEQPGRHQVHLHDRAVESQHEIGDGRQQVQIVEIRLFAFGLHALRAEDAIVEQRRGWPRHVAVPGGIRSSTTQAARRMLSRD